MASKKEIEIKIQEWKRHCEAVQAATFTEYESVHERRDRIRRLLAPNAYSDFNQYYFPHHAPGPSAPFHKRWNKQIRSTTDITAVYIAYRGGAKSSNLGLLTPLHLLALEKMDVIPKGDGIDFMLTVGKSLDDAKDKLSDIQAELEYNQRFINDFGEQKGFGNWEEGEFLTRDGKYFVGKGRGQSPRGLKNREQRPNYIYATDIDDDEVVRNPDRIYKYVDWILGALIPAGDVSRRFVMEGNRWAKDMILSRVLNQIIALRADQKKRGVKVTAFTDQVNILDRHGKPTWDRYNLDWIENQKTLLGYRRFQREFMNNPIEEGKIFKEEWIQYKKMPITKKYDRHIVYIDPSFKSSKASDYKAVKHWASRGIERHHIKAFVRQCSVSAMVKWCYDYYETLPDVVKASITFMMEANFLQDLILDEFYAEGEERGYMLPIIPDKRKKPDKFTRIEAMSPLWERGVTYYNEAERQNEDMKTGISQLLAFEKGSRAHDDGPDADEGAMWKLQRGARSTKHKPSFGQRTHRRAW